LTCSSGIGKWGDNIGELQSLNYQDENSRSGLNWLCLTIDAARVDGFSPSSWEPQEEGIMSTAASFSLSKKPRFVSPGKSQTPEGDAD
jgi:hypothetical protein